MTEFDNLEYCVTGALFAVWGGLFFFWAVPYYVRRFGGARRPPPLPTGNVPTAGFGLPDILGVGLLFGWYALNWGVSGGEASLLDEENLAVLLASQLVLQGVMGAAVLVFLVWRMDLIRAFGLRWRQWPWLFLVAPLGVFVLWSFMAALNVAGYDKWIAELAGGDPRQDAVQVLEQNRDPLVLVLMAMVACVGAPLSEELVFRGYLYGALKRFTGIRAGVFLSGLLFAAVHMNLAALLPLFVLGVLLAVLYEVTGSLWTPIAVHFLFNAGTVVIQFAARLWPELLPIPEVHEALVRPW